MSHAESMTLQWTRTPAMLWSPPQRYPPQGKIHSLNSVMLATRLSSNNLEQEKEEEVTKETTFKGQLLTHSCHVKLHIVTIVNVKHATVNVYQNLSESAVALSK